MVREDLICTNEVRVASISLDAGEVSPQHYHSQVIETIICLNGIIEVQYGDPGEQVLLQPGQRHDVMPKVKHKLLNVSDSQSVYLLIQTGEYDFITRC